MKSKLNKIFNNLGIKLFHKHFEESYQFDFLKCAMGYLVGRKVCSQWIKNTILCTII